MTDFTVTVDVGKVRKVLRDMHGRFARFGQTMSAPAPVRGAGGKFRAFTPRERREWAFISGGSGGGGKFKAEQPDDPDEPGYVEYIIGSDKPYASHWIEEGWRERGVGGRISINYWSPGAAFFIRKAAAYASRQVSVSIDGELIGVSATSRGGFDSLINGIVRTMQDTLRQQVYSRDPYNPGTKRRWTRAGQTDQSKGLIGSIQVRRNE